MQQAFETLITYLQGQALRDASMDALNVVIKQKPNTFLAYLLQYIYQSYENTKYVAVVPSVPRQHITKEFTVLTLFRLSVVLRHTSNAEIVNIYERSLLNLPRYPGAFSFFCCPEQRISSLYEARLFYKSSLPDPVEIENATQLKYAVAISTVQDVQYLFWYAVNLIKYPYAAAEDRCLMLVLATELIRKYKRGLISRCVAYEAMARFLSAGQQNLFLAIQNIKAGVEDLSSSAFKALAVRFYFTIVQYLSPPSFYAVHGFFSQACLRIIDQMAANFYYTTKTMLAEAGNLMYSPIVCKYLSGGKATCNAVLCLENDMIGTAAFLVNYYAITNINMTTGFSSAILTVYSAYNKSGDTYLLYLQASQSRAAIVSLITMLLTLIYQANSTETIAKISEALCSITFYSPETVIEPLKTVFFNTKTQVLSLRVFYHLIETMERQGFNKEYLHLLSFITYCMTHILYEQLRLVKDPNFKLSQFYQKSLAYYEQNREYKSKVEPYLMRLIYKVVRANYEHQLGMQQEMINDFLQLLIDSFCNTFCLDSYLRMDDSFILKLTELLPELRQQLLRLVIYTIFYRYFKCNQEQQSQTYNLYMQLYHGCFSMLNLIIHEEVDHYAIIQVMIHFKIEFIDVIALSTMLLLCLNPEKAESRFAMVSLREYVLSVLNYLVYVQVTDEYASVLQNFFGVKISKFGRYKSALNDYSSQDRYLVEIIISLSRLFITKLLYLFDFSKQNFSIHINFNDFFPGYKWRSYNPMIELSVNGAEKKKNYDQDYDRDSPTELSRSTTVSTIVEESEIDTYKYIIESYTFYQKLTNKCDEYVYQIFQYVYELLSLLQPSQSYQFYQRCYYSQLLYSTNIFIQRYFYYRLSILGLVRKLEGISFDYEDLVMNNNMMSIENNALVNEFADVLINCQNLQGKQLKLTDLIFLIDAISAASLQMILVLLSKVQQSSYIQSSSCLQIFQLAIRNPCMMDVFSDVKIRQTTQASGLFKSQYSQTIYLLNILILRFQGFAGLNIYKQLCYSGFHLLGLAYVLMEFKQIDQYKADLYIIDVISYLLQNSSFGPVDQTTGVILESPTAEQRVILQSDGFSNLLRYFTRKEYVEHFSAFPLNQYYASLLKSAGLYDLNQTEFDLQGVLSQCAHLWNQTIGQFISILANFRLHLDIKTLILLKALTILRIVQEHSAILPIYNSYIQPRLLHLIMACMESDFSHIMYRRIIDIFMGQFALCYNIDYTKYVQQLLLQFQAIALGLFDIPKQIARYLICDNYPFGSIQCANKQIIRLISYGQYRAVTNYIRQMYHFDGKDGSDETNVSPTEESSEMYVFMDTLFQKLTADYGTVQFILALMGEEYRYFNTILPSIRLLLDKTINFFQNAGDLSYLVIAHAVQLYYNIDYPRRKEFVATFLYIFILKPDMFFALLVYHAYTNYQLIGYIIADISVYPGLERFMLTMFELLRECFIQAVFCVSYKDCFSTEIIGVYINFLQALIYYAVYKDLLMKAINESYKVLFAFFLLLERIFVFAPKNINLQRSPHLLKTIISLFITIVSLPGRKQVHEVCEAIEYLQQMEQPAMQLDMFLKLFQSIFACGVLDLTHIEQNVLLAYSHNLESENLAYVHLVYCFACAGCALCQPTGATLAKALQFATYRNHSLAQQFSHITLNLLCNRVFSGFDVVNQQHFNLAGLTFKQNFDLDDFLSNQFEKNVTRGLIATTAHICWLKAPERFATFAIRLIKLGYRENLLYAVYLLNEMAGFNAEFVADGVSDSVFDILRQCDKGHSLTLFYQLICRIRGRKDFQEAMIGLLTKNYSLEQIISELRYKGGAMHIRMQTLLYMSKHGQIPQQTALEIMCETINAGFLPEDEQKSAVYILGQLLILGE